MSFYSIIFDTLQNCQIINKIFKLLQVFKLFGFGSSEEQTKICGRCAEGIFKNVSSSISHKKTPGLRDYGTTGLRDFSFFLPSIFIFEPILIKISMNANIMKT